MTTLFLTNRKRRSSFRQVLNTLNNGLSRQLGVAIKWKHSFLFILRSVPFSVSMRLHCVICEQSFQWSNSTMTTRTQDLRSSFTCVRMGDDDEWHFSLLFPIHFVITREFIAHCMHFALRCGTWHATVNIKLCFLNNSRWRRHCSAAAVIIQYFFSFVVFLGACTTFIHSHSLCNFCATLD